MDINTFKVIRNIIKEEKNEGEKPQEKKQDKKDEVRGCLKLADYIAF